MFTGSLGLWVGIPLGWLWIGGRIQGATGSLGAAVALALVGVVASVALMVPVLGWLNDKHRELRMSRGHDDTGPLVLEIVVATSAGVALVLFVGWLLLFSGFTPFPA
ncbi:MAG: hypothetical protein QOI98_2831 [Solirubrobacteraceae bacterium]|nr:hypothetical protein [Solirubrobacteraceae bacterium]